MDKTIRGNFKKEANLIILIVFSEIDDRLTIIKIIKNRRIML